MQGFWERNRDICFWGDGETVESSCMGEQQAPREWKLEYVARSTRCKCGFSFSALGCTHVSQEVLGRDGSHALAMKIPATCKQHCSPQGQGHAWRQRLAADSFGKAH